MQWASWGGDISWCWHPPFSQEWISTNCTTLGFLSWLLLFSYMCYVFGYINCFNIIARVVLTAWLTSMDIDVFIYTNNANFDLIRDFMFISGMYLIQKTQRASWGWKEKVLQRGLEVVHLYPTILVPYSVGKQGGFFSGDNHPRFSQLTWAITTLITSWNQNDMCVPCTDVDVEMGRGRCELIDEGG
jgi:hypothetical protein